VQEAVSKIENPSPDEEAGSDDPLLTVETRETTIQYAFKLFIEEKEGGEGEVLGGWRVHRVREDKNDPNFIKVAVNTWRSIVSSVSKEDLIDVCKDLEPTSNNET